MAKKSGNSLLVPALVTVIALVVGTVLANGASNDNGKDTVKTESTSTTKPKGTSTTVTSTSTPSGSSTTTTAPADPSDCTTGGFLSSPKCDSPDDPGTTDKKCSTILGHEFCAPEGGGGSDQPGGDVVLNLQKCQVDLHNIDYGFYHPGKLAVENFDAPFEGDVKTKEGQKEFLQDLVERGCVDPSAMASYARHLGIIPKDSDDATVNRLAVAYTRDVKRWQRHVNLMVKKLNAAVTVRVVENDDPNASTDGQKHVGGKRPPAVFKEPLKGSCPDIVEVWVQGEVFSFCPGCKQPVRRTPTAPPATPVTPPCTTCTPPPSTPTCRRNCGATTTTTPGHSTTTTGPPRTTTTTRPPATTTTTKPHGSTTTTQACGGPGQKDCPGSGTPGD
jgi:hypothetical protein